MITELDHLTTETTIEEFAAVCDQLAALDREVPWLVADAILFGYETYHDAPVLIVERFPHLSPARIARLHYLAEQFPPERRGDLVDRLSISMFEEVLVLPHDVGDRLLEQAADGQWTVKEIREKATIERRNIIEGKTSDDQKDTPPRPRWGDYQDTVDAFLARRAKLTGDMVQIPRDEYEAIADVLTET